MPPGHWLRVKYSRICIERCVISALKAEKVCCFYLKFPLLGSLTSVPGALVNMTLIYSNDNNDIFFLVT